MQNSEKMILVIRHGEREDDENLKYDKNKINKYDPKLTETGRSQAELIGNQVKEIIKKNLNKDLCDVKILLLSSPFLRTLMTSESFIEGLMKNNLESNNNVKIEMHYGLYEFLHERNFDRHPEKYLEINKKKNVNESIPILKNLFYGEKIINVILPDMFPESWQELIDRYRKSFYQIREEFMKSEYEVLILVTHGYAVKTLATELNCKDDCSIIDYCSTFIFKIDQDGNSIHLESLNLNDIF